MRPSVALLDHIEEVAAIIARYPVCNARIFGSAARGDDKDDSDLDILVDAVNGVSFYDLAQLELDLEALLEMRVDVLTPAGLAPDVAKAIADDLRPLDSFKRMPNVTVDKHGEMTARAERVRDVIASATIEGLEVTPYTKTLFDRYAEGKIEIDEVLEGISNTYGLRA